MDSTEGHPKRQRDRQRDEDADRRRCRETGRERERESSGLTERGKLIGVVQVDRGVAAARVDLELVREGLPVIGATEDRLVHAQGSAVHVDREERAPAVFSCPPYNSSLARRVGELWVTGSILPSLA